MCKRGLCIQLAAIPASWHSLGASVYLERPPHPENTVVRLLRWQALEGEEDDFGLFRNQIIGSVMAVASAPSLSAFLLALHITTEALPCAFQMLTSIPDSCSRRSRSTTC